MNGQWLMVWSLFLFSDAALTSENIQIISGQFSQQEAETRCRRLGPYWGLPLDQSEREPMKEYMEIHSLNTVWLGVHANPQPAWRWTNYNRFSPDPGDQVDLPVFQNYDNMINRCGVLAVRSKNEIGSVPCFVADNKYGFVCEKRDRGHTCSCPIQHFTQACIRVGGSCYAVGCHIANWYEARKYCMDNGGYLAVLDSPKKQNRILNYLEYISDKHGQVGASCDMVMIGAIKEHWKPSHNLSGIKILTEHWANGTASKKNDSCVEMSLGDKSIGWHSADCNKKQAAICQNYGLQPMLTESPVNIEDSLSTIVILPVLSVTAVIIFLLAVIIRIRWVSRKKGKTFQEDIELLLPCDWHPCKKKHQFDQNSDSYENSDTPELPPCDYATVVTFSEKMKDDRAYTIKLLQHSTERQRCGVFERLIADCVKWVLEQILFKPANDVTDNENETDNENIRFMTICCLQDRVLYFKEAMFVFRYIKYVISNIQIVTLPEISARDSTAEHVGVLLEILRCLRKSSVLIHQPKDPFNIFSNEAITVSPDNGMSHLIDFVITREESLKDEQKELARAVGFIAAIYNSLARHEQDPDEVDPWNTSNIRKLLCHLISSNSVMKERPNCRIMKGPWNISDMHQNRRHILKRIRKLLNQEKKMNRKNSFPIISSQIVGCRGKIQVLFLQHRIERDIECEIPINEEGPINEIKGFSSFMKGLFVCCSTKQTELVRLVVIGKGAENWDKLDDCVKGVKRPCIVHMNIPGIPPVEHSVLLNTQRLSHRTTLVSPSRIEDFRIPYPNTFSISVGTTSEETIEEEDVITIADNNIELQPLNQKKTISLTGSSVDFRIAKGHLEGPTEPDTRVLRNNQEEEIEPSLAASCFMAGVLASLFVKATYMGIDSERMEKLKQTHVIRSILSLYSQNRHSSNDEWGCLNVREIKDASNHDIRDAIYHFTHPKRAPRNYWNGKNL